MSNVDDLLREFRADVPDPAEGAAERILERASAARPEPEPGPATGVAPPPRRRMPGRRWVLLPVAVAAGVCLAIAIALAPTRDATDGGPTLLERAEAAITAPNRIVELSTTIRSDSSGTGAINPRRTINMRQWTLAGAGQAVQFRILISEGPLDKPPTDEDSTTMTDRSGRIIDSRSWNPLHVTARDNYDYPRGGGRGELQIWLPKGRLQGPLTLVDQLREAYRSDELKPVGRTAGGDLRFRMEAGDTTCTRWEYVLDAQTLLPRRMEITNWSKPCGTGAKPIQREVQTFGEARSLPATAENRRLLAIADWPTERILQDVAKGDSKRIDRAPPVPKLDEG